ncbi:cobalt-precorrin-5B (C(1))-methyltransferase [Aestuariivirga litoralis]|uniref:cobalt-precorrin-5B (C(1))-methyltransferase n=1 Tax=Aestuariivirga litoralis TaxID=2650924 RepID=UPI0018C514C1|nr:cobalt-precorrin-5B (C(1))-methyltransferase [Aestuariivirga litoralis]MBG1231331.1 cobalt-precorrin-5B (C(1))-methyltransferase [Aestuariivirga litoralis]
MRQEKPEGSLKRGWTTGACATAAVKAAYTALLTGAFPDPVTITLPKGEQPAFALAITELKDGFARVGIVKDAGDDPDVTHGCTVVAKVWRGGKDVSFKAGEGVGMVTKPGLPIAVGEPAINPGPRAMMMAEIAALGGGDVEIEISIPGGAALAAKTWNPRLGIVGGLSVLGTTGIVHPFSCAAWIASIHRGIDVARALGLAHVAGCTGSTSEDSVRAHYGLPLEAMLDMGDFAGGVLKYVRAHPVPRLTIGGGFGKMVKLAQGHMDLHSGRSQVDFEWLAARAPDALKAQVLAANSALEVLELCGQGLAQKIAQEAQVQAAVVLGSATTLDVIVVDRVGKIIGHAA